MKRNVFWRRTYYGLMGTLVAILLAACNQAGALPTSTDATARSTATPTTAPSPTPPPPVSFTVCTASLPESLPPINGSDLPIGRNLLALLEGTPADILAQPLTVANDAITLAPVPVQPGQRVVDARGELATLKAGVRVRPSGCRQSDCAQTWDGQTPLEMDQASITFTLADGLAWSDGVPVTAADSVWRYGLASDPASPGLHWAASRTASYTAVDDRQVVWVGKPGFTTAAPADFFWLPLPSHLLPQEPDWQALSEEVTLTRRPVSYGAFTIAAWEADQLRLVKNPYYIQKEMGEPLLDQVIVQVIEDPDQAIQALKEGRCDLLDQTYRFQTDPDRMASLQADADLNLLVEETRVWEQLVLGIQPASYDDYYNPVYGDRPDLLGDARARQALAACLDREQLGREVFGVDVTPWLSFLPPDQSQAVGGDGMTFDPALGADLLAQAGWRDHDFDPQTPLQAWGVANVPMGTTFDLTLLVDDSPQRQKMAIWVQDLLSACGVGVTVETLPAAELYAPGPGGPLFGRAFDLAFMAWQPLPSPDCGLYTTWQIPDTDNFWIGTNTAGYADDAYDVACVDASLALPAESAGALLGAENAFVTGVPTIPLFGHPEVMLVRTADCGESLPGGGASFYAQIEALAAGLTCP